MPITYRADGSLHFGDSVLVRNNLTSGQLAADLGDRLTGNDEAYAVTTTS